jgi:hypothetical protein
MSCTNYFSNDNRVNYERTISFNMDADGRICDAIGTDNQLIKMSKDRNVEPNVIEIKCNAIKPNSKLIAYTYRTQDDKVISCPIGGWFNSKDNQTLLQSNIKNNEIKDVFSLKSANNSDISINELCQENGSTDRLAEIDNYVELMKMVTNNLNMVTDNLNQSILKIDELSPVQRINAFEKYEKVIKGMLQKIPEFEGVKSKQDFFKLLKEIE